MNRHASMNRIYRLVWSDRLLAWVVVPEFARGRGKSSGVVGAERTATGPVGGKHHPAHDPGPGLRLTWLARVVGATFLAAAGSAFAAPAVSQTPVMSQLPTGGSVAAGQATISQSGARMDINQSSNRAVLNWDTFNVGASAQVNFNQPSASSATLNRVADTQASQILGRVTSNGQVFLVNPNGIYFGKTASVDVGGLVATTHNIGDADFMAGNTKFSRDGSTGSVVNEGQLRAALGGYIAMLAPEVRNQGVIVAQLGTVAMASGEAVTLQFDSNNTLAGIVVEPSKVKALVENKGAVVAPGGVIIMSAKALDRLQGGVVRNTGTLEAQGMSMKGGKIVLEASDSIVNSGTISANAGSDGSPAGSVTLAAPHVDNQGVISASAARAAVGAAQAGGRIEIAATDFVQSAGARLDVAGLVNGGAVTVKAADSVELGGTVDASAAGGSGGTIDVKAGNDVTIDSGVLDASGDAGGKVVVAAGVPDERTPTPAPGVPQNPPTVAILGESLLSSRSRRSQGGSVTLTGEHVGLFDHTRIDASGATGGGTVLVGGDYQGKNPDIANAAATYVGADVAIDASATGIGAGGKVIVWADDTTRFQGTISATGGSEGGDGGFVEVSGKGQLDFQGRVDTRAAAGQAGTLLLDPYNLTISAGADAGTSAGAGAFDASGSGSILNVSTLQNALASSNVTVTTGSSGAEAGNITVASTVGWFSDYSLTLSAANNIAINGGVNVVSAGNGNVTLNAGLGSITNGGTVRTFSGSLSANAGTTIGGAGVYNVAGAATLTAANGITLANAANTFAGALSLSATNGAVQLVNNVATSLKGVTAGAGGIAITSNGAITGAASPSGITSGGALSLATAAGTNSSINYAGPVSAGGTITLSADGTGAISMADINGNATFSSVTAGGAVTLGDGATGALVFDSASGNVISGTPGAGGQASGIVTITGSSITLNDAVRTKGGNVNLISTSGAVTANAGATITTTADTDTGTASGAITVTAANGMSLQNLVTTGAANALGVGSNAAAVTLSATTGNLNVAAIDTSGGNATGSTSNRNGGNAGNIILGAPAGTMYLNGDLTAIGGSPVGSATQGLGGYVELQSKAVLTGDRLVSSGGTSGDIVFMSTVDSNASARKLTVTAGTGSVTFAEALGGTAALSSLNVTSANIVKVQGNLTTNAAAGVSVNANTTRLGDDTVANGSGAITVDTSAGNGTVNFAPGLNTANTVYLDDAVTFKRGTGQITLTGDMLSKDGERNDLTFTGTGGGAVVIGRTLGGSGTNANSLGNILFNSGTDFSVVYDTSAKSLVALNNTGQFKIGYASNYTQTYDGAGGLQLRTTGTANNVAGDENITVYGNVNVTNAAAPISITAPNGGITVNNYATLSSAGGNITLDADAGALGLGVYSSMSSNGGTITLNGIGVTQGLTDNAINAGSGKIRIDGGGAAVNLYSRLMTTDADSGGTSAILVTNAGGGGSNAASLRSVTATGGTLQVGVVGGTAVAGSFSQYLSGWGTDSINIRTLSAATTGAIAITSSSNIIDQLGNFSVGSSLDVRAKGRSAGMALTGDVAATSVTIMTGNGALALGGRNITSTSGNVLLQGTGVTQSAGSTITSAGSTQIYGNDYQTGTRGNMIMSGAIASSGNVDVLAANSVQLPSIIIGSAGTRGTLTLGANSYNNNPYQTYNAINGNITQAAGTALKIGTLNVFQQNAGSVTLANAANEIGTLGPITRTGALSIYDKDSEGNGLAVNGGILGAYATTTIATEGALNFSMGDWLYTTKAILSGASISGNLYVNASANNDVVLRANGGNVNLTGGTIQTTGTGNIVFQSANNVAIGANLIGSNTLQLGNTGTGTALAASQTASAGNLTLNGGSVSAGTATFGNGQRVAVASSDANTVYTITGTDAFGRAQSESVTGSGTGTKYFSTVTQIAADRAGATVTVGTATETLAGNVTQSNYLTNFAKLQGSVGGSIALTNGDNTFAAVGDLAAGSDISLYSRVSPLTINGAVASSGGNVNISGAYALNVASTGSVTANGAAKGVTLTADTTNNNGYGLNVQGAISAGSGGITLGANLGAVATSGAGTLTTSGTATLRSASVYTSGSTTDYSTTIGAAVAADAGIAIASAGSFTNTAAGTLTSAAGGIAIKTYWDGTSARNLTLGGNVTASANGIQLTSAGTINQTAGVLTTAGTLSGLNQTGGSNLGDSSPSARGAITLTGTNHIGSLGPFYVYNTTASAININDADGGLTLTGSIESSHGAVNLSTAGGALNLATYNVYAGGQATGGANISLTGQGIIQSQGNISASGGSNGNARTGANGGGTITLTGYDGSAYGTIALSGTLETASADATAAIKIRGTNNLMLPNVNAPNGTLALGDDTGAAGLITGNITQAVNTALNVKTLTIGTANNAVGGSAVLANANNKIVQLGLSKVGNVAGTQYDLDIFDVDGGLNLTGDLTSAGGLRIRTAKGTGTIGTLALGSKNVTASGDVFLGGESVSQTVGSTINADGAGTNAVGGSIRVDGGGGTNSIDLSGTVTTDNAGATAIQIVNAKDVTLNMVSALNGTVALGIPANTDGAATPALALTGTVSQTTPGTSLLSAQTLAVKAGVVTLSKTTLDNLGTVATTGALTLTDTGGNAGTPGLKLTGNATLGAASSITSTDGTLDLGTYGIDATGVDLKLKGVGVRQSAGSSVKSTTADIAGNSGDIDLFSNLNDFTGQVTVTGSGNSVRLQDANQLSMNVLTNKLANTTSFTAWAGTQLVMTPEDITTTSGSIELRSLGGNLLTPGKLATGSGNITLFASGTLTLANSLQSDSGDITLTGAAIASRSGAGDFIRTAAGGDITVTATAGNFTQGLDVLYQTANGDLTVNAQAGNANLANLKSDAGTVRVNAGGDILQQAGTTINAAGIEAVTKKAAGGAINLTAAGNHANYITLRSLNADGSATAAGTIQYLDNNSAGFAVRQIDTTGTATLTAYGAITTDSATGPGTVKAGTLNVKTLNDSGASVSLTAAGNDVGTLGIKVRKADDSAIAGSTANDSTTGAAGTVRFTDANGFVVSGIETGASTILSAGGSVTQTGAIDSAKLGLSGSGSFTLNAAASGVPLNRFGTIASNTSGAVNASSQLAVDIGTVANLPAGVASQGAAFTLGASAISASAGIDTRSGSDGTSGGAVNLTTTGSGASGNLAVGAINTSGKAAASGSGLAGGAAGNVTLSASGDSLVVGGAIVARGAAGDGAGATGADGTVKLLTAAGAVSQAANSGGIDAGKLDVLALNTSALLATGNKASLLAARITGTDQDFSYRSAANFTIGGGDASIPGITTQGGDIILDNNAVTITVNEPVSTRGGAFSALNVGGFNAAGVTISTGGDVTYAGGAYKNGGAIRITSGTGSIVTGTLSADGDSSAAAANAGAVTVSTGGNATVGNISARGVGSGTGGAVGLTGGVVNLAGNIDTSGGGVDASAAAGGTITVTGPAIVQGGAHSLSTGAGAGDIQFTGTIDSDGTARDLSLTAGTGNIGFGGTVGGLSALNNVLLVSAKDVTLAGVKAANLTQVAGTGTTTLGGAVNLGSKFSFTGNQLAVNAALNAAGTVAISNAGLFSTAAAGDITAAGGFTQNGTGANQLAGDITTTGTGISFATPVALRGSVTLRSNGGNIAFADALDSDTGTPASLVLNTGTGNATLAGKVGAGAALDALTVAAAHDVTASSTVNAASFTQQAGSGTTTFAKALTLSGNLAFTGAGLSVSDAATVGGSVTVGNSGVFTLGAGASVAATGGFVQNGTGTSALAGSITTPGANIGFGQGIVLTGDASLSTGNANGKVTLAAIDGDGVQPRKLAVTAGAGGIALDGNVGAAKAVDTLYLKSAGAIGQGAGTAVKATNLGIEASADVTLDNAGNDVGTLAASLNGNAGLQFRDANGFVLGSVTAAPGTLAGLTDNAGSSSVGFTAGGLVAQASGAAILLNGNLSIDTSTYNAGNVSVTNTNATGTLLDNTLVGNDFTLDSTGPITQRADANGTAPNQTDAYLRVGGTFQTPHGSLIEGASSDNFFQGGAASVADANQIRLNGVITLSQSGNMLMASYVDASGNNHVNAASVDLSQVTTPVSIVSDAGGKTIVAVNNTSAVTLTQANRIGGALKITTYGGYQDTGIANATGIVATDALNIAKDVSFTAQQSSANAGSAVNGVGQVQLANSGNVFGGTVSASARGMGIQIADSTDLRLGNVLGSQLLLDLGQGASQASGTQLNVGSLVIRNTAGGGGTVTFDQANLVDRVVADVNGALTLNLAGTFTPGNASVQVAGVKPFNGDAAIEGIQTHDHALALSSGVDLDIGAPIDSGTAATTIAATAKGQDLVLGGAGNSGDLVLDQGELANIHAGSTRFAVNGGGSLAAGDVNFNAGNVTLQASDVALSGNIGTGAGDTLAVEGATQLDADTALTGNAHFKGTVDSKAGAASKLAVHGDAVFGAGVGQQAGGILDTLAVDGKATLAGAVSTTGTQAYGDAVTLGADTTLKGTNVTLNGAVDGQSHGLTVDGNAVTHGAIANLTDLAVTGTAGIGGNVTTSGSQAYTGAATLGTDVTLASTGGGAIGFSGTLDGAHALTVATSGSTTFGGVVGGTTALSSLGTDAGGTTRVDGGAVNTSGAQAYGDKLVLGADTTLASGSGGIGFAGTVDAASGAALNLNAGSGNVDFSDTVGASGALGAVGINSSGVTRFGGTVNAASVATDAAGSTRIDGGAVTTTGGQRYADDLSLGMDTTLGGSTVATGGKLAGGGHDLVIAGNAVLGDAAADAVTGLDSLAVTGTTALNGGSIVSSGAQHFGGAVKLGNDTVLATNGGAVTFDGTVDAAGAGKDLTVNAGSGAVTFGGAVGSTASGALGKVAIGSSGATAFGGSVNAGSLNTDAGGTTSLNGNVTTTADQTYGDAVQVQSDLTFKTAGGDLVFADALDQAAGQNRKVTVDTGRGSADFTGPVTLASLDIASASGATLNNGGNAVGAIAGKLGNGGLSFANTSGVTVGIGADGIVSGGAVAIHAQSGNVVLERGISVSGLGSIVLDAAGGNFVNHAGATALATASGGWQVYSTSPSSDERGGLTPNFKQYNAHFGDLPASGGNGFVYRIAPVITGQLTGDVRKVYDGGTSAVLAGANYLSTLGAIDGDVVTLNTPVFGNYDSKTAGTGKMVTVNGVQILNAMDGNVAVYGYQLASNTVSGAVGTVDKAMIQVANLVALNKVYDGSDTAYLNTQAAKATGVIAGDQISLVSATGYYVDGKNVGAGKAIVADDIKLAGADKDNYQMVPTTGLSSDITPRALVVSASGGSKTYDVTTATQVALGDNRVDGDVLDIAYQANYLDKNAGTNKYIRVSDIAISGQDAQNYTVNTTAASFGDIAKADLTVHAEGVSRTYDGTTNATVILSADRATAAMQADQLTLSYEAAMFTSKAAGLGKTINVLGVRVGGADAGNYNVNVAPAGTATADISGLHLTLSGVQALDKVYDGTTNAVLNLANASLTGVVAGDSVSFLGTLGSGVFAGKNASASPIAVSVTGNGIQLTGKDADGYVIDLPTNLSASITPKALTAAITAPGKVYDGNTLAAPTVTITGGLVGNEQLGVTGTASFDSKNVGSRVVTLDTVALHDDAASDGLASNYVLVAGQTTSADITRLASVTWTGGPDGKWFDPKNWEGGAIPDYANVKDVLIPGGVTIDFDPAPNGTPVSVDSITGNGGTLNIGGGTLNTGRGGVRLGGYKQTGGTVTSGGNVTVNTFVQTGGTTIVEKDFTATGGFNQGGNGTLTVGGTTTIVTDGGVVIGNLTSEGELDVTSKGGPISQAEGTTIVTKGETTLTSSGDIDLRNKGNDFGGPVTVDGKDVRLSDKNDLTVGGKTSGGLSTESGGGTTLGDTTVGGKLDVNAKGPVNQTGGGTVTVGGGTTLTSGGDIDLRNKGNDFGGPVTVDGKDVHLGDKNDLTVGGKTSGGLSTTSGGATTIGNTTVGGKLDATSGGAIGQSGGTTLHVTGSSTLVSGGDVTLANMGNDFGGAVTASGKNVSLNDSAGGITLGTVNAGGTLLVAATGAITQAPGQHLEVAGYSTFISGTNELELGGAGNALRGGSNLNSVTVLTPVTPAPAMPVPGTGPQVQAVGNVTATGNVTTTAAVTVEAAPASLATPATVAGASGIVVRTVETANATRNGLISVGVPKSVGSFVFKVPAEAFADQGQGGLSVNSVALENGASLPSWLQFNVNDLSFTATSVPANGLPLRVVVTTEGKRVVVVISELEGGNK